MRGTGALRVPVDDGHLVVHRLNAAPAGAQAVVALHSVSSNALSWQPVADRLAGRVRVLAPDMRGRAESAALRSGGLAHHARDVVAVADHLGLARPVVAGHSVGAFAATLAAASYPDRFSGLVMVDGGVALPEAGPREVDTLLRAALGPAMSRLRMTFADEAEYLEFWRRHPGLAPFLDGPTRAPLVAFLLHDLVGEPGALHSSTPLGAVRSDWSDLVSDAATLESVHALQVPAHLLWAVRGPLDEPEGLYTAEALERARLPEDLALTRLATNHYGTLLDPAAVAAVARAIEALTALPVP
jgi:pimeloyl-ACP methyl ester carboxylesterase